MGKQIKSSLLIKTLLQKVLNLPTIQLFISTWKKAMKTHHSPPHVSAITGNILITIIRFARYDPLLASDNTFNKTPNVSPCGLFFWWF